MAASRCWLTLVGALAVAACQSESEAGSGKHAHDKSADANEKDAALAPKPDPLPLRGITPCRKTIRGARRGPALPVASPAVAVAASCGSPRTDCATALR